MANLAHERLPAKRSSIMEAMRAAFYRVCDILQLSGDREDPVTKIVELAKAGERHPEILCIDVLADLRSASTRRDITSATGARRDSVCRGERAGPRLILRSLVLITGWTIQLWRCCCCWLGWAPCGDDRSAAAISGRPRSSAKAWARAWYSLAIRLSSAAAAALLVAAAC
jgi:hypothetical protein